MRLDDAVTSHEILAAVAGFIWWDLHKKECPPNSIPTMDDLTDWLPECTAKARTEATTLLAEIFDKVWAVWWDCPSDGYPTLLARLTEEVTLVENPQEGGSSGEGRHYISTFVGVADVHQAWLKRREARDQQRHPLEPLVRAWQGRTVLRQPNKRNDPLLPVIRPIQLRVPLEREAAQMMLGLVPDSSEEKAMPLFPRFPDLSNQARRVPLLALADASGTPSRSYGKGAALDLRLVIETTLSIDPDDRVLSAIALVFKVGELRHALFPNTWRKGRDWPRMREALLRAHTRSIPIDERGNQWFPLVIRQLPSETGMRLDDEVIIEVALPPGSKTGPIINRQELRQLSIESSPKYRAYIGVHSLAWEPGVTRIVNPTTKKRGWAGSPTSYPVLTLNDRRMIAFGPSDTKHRTREEINEAFTNLPNIVVIEKDAVDRKTGATGWRVVPNEAANAVRGWIKTKKEKSA